MSRPTLALLLCLVPACDPAAPALDTPSLDATSALDTSQSMDSAVANDANAPGLDAPDQDAPAVAMDDAPRDAPALDSPAASEGSCDARRVSCDLAPPTCAANEAPSVSGSCWGPCILATECTCTDSAQCPDVRGYSEVCHTGRGFCGPLL